MGSDIRIWALNVTNQKHSAISLHTINRYKRSSNSSVVFLEVFLSVFLVETSAESSEAPSLNLFYGCDLGFVNDVASNGVPRRQFDRIGGLHDVEDVRGFLKWGGSNGHNPVGSDRNHS